MGIAVFKGERVYVHSGTGLTFYGCTIDSPALAAEVLTVLATLEGLGNPIQPFTGATPSAA